MFVWPSLRAVSIIAALLLALGVLPGCSALRVGYDSAPQLAWWWLDGYADFDAAQRPRVRAAIDDWFAWHRRDQLPAYAVLLERARADVARPTVEPSELCSLFDAVRGAARPALEATVAPAAQLAPTLSEAQLRHIEQRFAKSNDEFRDDYLQEDLAERRRAALKRTVERLDMLYGSVEGTQRERLVRGIAGSPFDAERWLGERKARQADILATLRKLRGAPPEQAQAALRALAERIAVSPREDYRRYERTLDRYNCQLAAEVHALATPGQREHAVERLEGWIGDLRALVAEGPRPAVRPERTP